MSFDENAKTWDTEHRITRANIIANEIRESIKNLRKDSAMEFGCGTGLISFNLCEEFKSITLIDSSKGMIDILNSKLSKYNITNMIAKQIDIMNEDTYGMKFDVIYNSMALHHIPDTESIVKKFYELLEEDGSLFIVDLDEEDGRFHMNEPEFDGHNGFQQKKLKEILHDAGFLNIESTTFYYDEKIIDGENIKYSLFLMGAHKDLKVTVDSSKQTL